MNHIANCMRPDGERSAVSINSESSFRITSTQDTTTIHPPNALLAKTPSLASLSQPTTTSSRYQFWSTSRSPASQQQLKNSSSLDKITALSAGRSSTSLSDTAVLPESVPLWQRTGALTRRRKVSVPELGNTMATVQEVTIDSPTIPGRPPLRQLSYETLGHERSCSAPGTNWRAGPFGDAMISCVTGPSPVTESTQPTPGASLDTPRPSAMPLSPIMSSLASPKSLLRVDTAHFAAEPELPPQVPPKSPAVELKGSPTPLTLRPKASRTQLLTPVTMTSGGNTPPTAIDMRRSPNAIILPTPPTAFTNPFNAASQASIRGSPRIERRNPLASSHNRNMSESAVMDRGRPSRRPSKSKRSRALSEATKLEATTPSSWRLPQGMRISEASSRMSDEDKFSLNKQAYDQAGKFEILNKRDVASLSRELRALDERCDYLRKTYKSLRAGRQKLHGRMIAYLRRGETVIFSRESLLKQEEALAELDVSIDEFILKLEQAENRRLRLRQKLLEHVAAAIVLNPSAAREDIAQTTPTRSPAKVGSPGRAANRHTTESIKIYADGHVLNLFSDIEKAIGKMCEQTC